MLTVLCLIFIAVTMFFRAADLRKKHGIVWRIRTAGLVITGVAAIACMLHDWLLHGGNFTTSETFLLFGLVLVFSTSPHMPPYWKWLSGLVAPQDGVA